MSNPYSTMVDTRLKAQEAISNLIIQVIAEARSQAAPVPIEVSEHVLRLATAHSLLVNGTPDE